MKPLKPSHREKRRYLLIKGNDCNRKNIEETISEYVGILGFAKACPEFIKENQERIILSINRKSLNDIRASFVISNKDLRIVNISGSLKKLEN